MIDSTKCDFDNISQFHDELRQQMWVVMLNIKGRKLHWTVAIRNGRNLYHLKMKKIDWVSANVKINVHIYKSHILILCKWDLQNILTWVPSIPLIGFLEPFELDALKIPPDLLLMITASEVDVKLSLALEPWSIVGHPFEFPELPPILSGINGSIDSVTIELRHGSSSSCTIFVEFTEEVTFLGLKLVLYL